MVSSQFFFVALSLVSNSFLCSRGTSVPHPPLHIGTIINPVPELLPTLYSDSTALQLSAHQAILNASRNGLTLDYCATRQDCQGRRKCSKWKQIADGDSCDTGWLCLCNPPKFKSCVASQECPDGESCLVTMRTTTPICISETAEAPRGLVPWGVDISDDPTESIEEGTSMQSSNGLNYDTCRKTSDCQGDGICGYIGIFSIKFDECGGRKPCRCWARDGDYPCFDPQDCGPGEMCAETAITSFAFCISKSVSPVGIREIPFTGDSTGLNLDSCRNADDCRGNRICLQWIGSNTNVSECSGLRPCVCLSPERLGCGQSSECVDGEVCSALKLFSVPVCISRVMEETFLGIEELPTPSGLDPVAPNLTPEDPFPSGEPQSTSEVFVSEVPNPSTAPVDEVACIDARALRHLGSEQLIFERDVSSRVLCDGKGNCATEGHMVVVHGKPMMMRTYCEGVKCVKRVMAVNSPRYKKGMRIESNSGELQYTAFSARYSTRTEEGILSVAVKAGL